jgi:hypothetical protein
MSRRKRKSKHHIEVGTGGLIGIKIGIKAKGGERNLVLREGERMKESTRKFAEEQCAENRVRMKRELILKTLHTVGSVDNFGNYWGHDTCFDSIDELVEQILEEK